GAASQAGLGRLPAMVLSSIPAAWDHRAVKSLIALFFLLILALSACRRATDKQWYKPNSDYTTAEVERDRVACTPKGTNALDEPCMLDRGWLPLSGDIGPAVKAPQMPRPRGGKY